MFVQTPRIWLRTPFHPVPSLQPSLCIGPLLYIFSIISRHQHRKKSCPRNIKPTNTTALQNYYLYLYPTLINQKEVYCSPLPFTRCLRSRFQSVSTGFSFLFVTRPFFLGQIFTRDPVSTISRCLSIFAVSNYFPPSRIFQGKKEFSIFFFAQAQF